MQILGLAFVPALFDNAKLASCRSVGAHESERLPQADSVKRTSSPIRVTDNECETDNCNLLHKRTKRGKCEV